MVTKVLDPSDIAKSEVDEHGGYDLIVDMNQIGLPEYKSPPQEIHFEGQRFHKAGLVHKDGVNGPLPAYWSYWNDTVRLSGNPAINLQLHTTKWPGG